MDKYALITRNTQEIISENELKALLIEKESPVVYIGTAITGRPHVGYYMWVRKVADFLNAGLTVKVLLADIHGMLENTSIDVLEKRYEYYVIAVQGMLQSFGVALDKLQFVKGSDFQLTPKYTKDLLRLSTLVSIHDAQKAGSEVVKQHDSPKLGGLMYPLMQCLDEEYLGVDIQYGGMDQRKILVLAREVLPKLGYKARIEIMTPIIPGLIGKKMSASDGRSKIDLLDDIDSVKSKMKKADFVQGDTDNGIMGITKYVLFPWLEDDKKEFVIERPEKFGGNVSFSNYVQLEKAVVENTIHPLDVKNTVAKYVSELLMKLPGKELLSELSSSFEV